LSVPNFTDRVYRLRKVQGFPLGEAEIRNITNIYWTRQLTRYWQFHVLGSRVRCLSSGGVRNSESRW